MFLKEKNIDNLNNLHKKQTKLNIKINTNTKFSCKEIKSCRHSKDKEKSPFEINFNKANVKDLIKKKK